MNQPEQQACQPETEAAPTLPPCPFCGSTNLIPGFWCLDDGEVDAVECGQCYAGAPVESWNKRT